MGRFSAISAGFSQIEALDSTRVDPASAPFVGAALVAARVAFWSRAVVKIEHRPLFRDSFAWMSRKNAVDVVRSTTKS
jgi:hypothetical protein